MLEKFNQDNKAELIRNAIRGIDFDSADITEKERQIYKAILNFNKKPASFPPISPLAEPFNLNELVGDHFNIAIKELGYNLKRIDNIYLLLNESNNSIQAELESVEKSLQKTTDAVQDIGIAVGDETKEYYWISDTFNDSSFVDLNKSDCLVDTDYGMVTLAPQRIDVVNNYFVTVNHEESAGIPGCNLLVLNLPSKNPTQEPNPTYEKNDTRNLLNILDNDPTTWFEVERNFIPPVQKLSKQGRAFVYSEASATTQDVLEATNNLDWKIIVDWGDGNIDAGQDSKGVPLAEFLDIEKTTANVLPKGLAGAAGSLFGAVKTPRSLKAKLSLQLELLAPTVLSSLKLLPLVRMQESINVDSIQVLPDGEDWITIAADFELGSNKATNKLQREILRRTGFQSTGSIIANPTDLPITKIKILLSSDPVLTKYGLAHPFKEIQQKIRTERNHLLYRTVDKRIKWERIAISENPPQYQVKNSQPKLMGALVDLAKIANFANNLYQSLPDVPVKNSAQAPQGGGLTPGYGGGSGVGSGGGGFGGIGGGSVSQPGAGPLAAAGQITSLAPMLVKAGGTLGQVGTFLGTAAPYVGAFLALNSLVGGFFHVNKSIEIISTTVGYDIFKGYRAAVGLRGIDLLKSSYADSSTIQTVKRQFPGPVSKVGLFVDEYIPAAWGPGDWISYSISEDGSTWIAIPKLTDTTLERSYAPSKPITELYFRATMKGNPADPYHTPTLNHFALMGVPQ
jgi:hypothetical protein